MKQCAIYLRVSTQKQNASHLGLESQMQICESYIKEKGGQLVRVFQDVQSGKSKDRKGLLDAIEFCKKNKCELVFAKLDRLARDVEFTFKVVNTGIQVHFCDMPQLPLRRLRASGRTLRSSCSSPPCLSYPQHLCCC